MNVFCVAPYRVLYNTSNAKVCLCPTFFITSCQLFLRDAFQPQGAIVSVNVYNIYTGLTKKNNMHFFSIVRV
jgi:hypothetical protein